jgi:hypothetical protein
MKIKPWRPCCPYPRGQVVEHDGTWWVSTRRTGRGEAPGAGGAWAVFVADLPPAEAARALDERIGVEL